jgi:hypothetical protein
MFVKEITFKNHNKQSKVPIMWQKGNYLPTPKFNFDLGCPRKGILLSPFEVVTFYC